LIKLMVNNQEIFNFLAAYYNEPVPENIDFTGCHSFVLGVYQEGLIGCFPFNIHDEFLEIHACFKPEYRGKFAVHSAKKAFEWVFSNTCIDLIKTETKERHASRFAVLSGMRRNGNYYEVSRWADL